MLWLAFPGKSPGGLVGRWIYPGCEQEPHVSSCWILTSKPCLDDRAYKMGAHTHYPTLKKNNYINISHQITLTLSGCLRPLSIASFWEFSLSENRVPQNPMNYLHIPIKWQFAEYPLFFRHTQTTTYSLSPTIRG